MRWTIDLPDKELMHRKTLHRLILVLAGLSVGVVACGDSSHGGGVCAAGLKAGQLVITELMPDPARADTDGIEWFELHNPGPDALPLTEVGLEVSKVDGSSAKGHRILTEDITIEPGAYLTFGRIAGEFRPEYINYGYGADLTMGNTAGKIRVVCGAVIVDEVFYEDLKDGVSRQLGARAALDAEANDDPSNWCGGSEPYGEEFGTPRAANSECPLPQPECGQCYEGYALRDSMPPRKDQLVINEFMPNASSAPESVGEWFEIYVADGPVDLNCLQFGGNTTKFLADPGDAEVLLAPTCQTVTAGDYVLFGDIDKWPDADHDLGFTIVDSKSSSNPNPGIYLAYNNDILDEIHYIKTTDGVAWSLDPDLAAPADNDDPAAFCLAVDPFIAGELGTPGAENPQCPTSCPAGNCLDGDTCRAINYLAPGDLLITEVFPDPGAMSPDGEWFEFIVAADADLNGLTFGKTLESPYVTVPAGTCRPIAAGTAVLVAATDDSTMNGELPPPDIVDTHIALTNTDSSLVIGVATADGTPVLLDQAAWAGTSDGKAHQLALELISAGPFDDAINDDPAAWCDANATFGVGDFGTPGATNTSCKAPDPMCLDGNGPRLIKFPDVGDLLISEVHPDPSALLAQNPDSGEPQGEWFELYVAADVDLNGLELGSPALKYTVPIGDTEPCVHVFKGSFAAFARRGDVVDPPVLVADPLDNGGLPTPTVQYDSLGLSNSGGTLTISLAGSELDSTVFAKPKPGKAQQLGSNSGCFLPDAPLDPACNDDPGLWCPATLVYGLGDYGTPEAVNGLCIPTPGPGECFDAGLMMNRPIVAPVMGDLVITEYLANPSGTETNMV